MRSINLGSSGPNFRNLAILIKTEVPSERFRNEHQAFFEPFTNSQDARRLSRSAVAPIGIHRENRKRAALPLDNPVQGRPRCFGNVTKN